MPHDVKYKTKAAKEAYMKKMKKDKKGLTDDRHKPGKAYTSGNKAYGMRKKES